MRKLSQGRSWSVRRSSSLLNLLGCSLCVRKVSPLLCAGKLGSEEDTKEEFRMEREPPATHEEGLSAVLLFLPLLYAETQLHLKPSEDLSSGFCFVGRSCNDGWTYATFTLQRCVRQVDQLCGHDDITSWGTEKSTLTMVYPNCLPFVSHLRE